VTTTMQAGVKVTRPDYWAVRVSLLGVGQEKMEALITKMLRDKRPEAAKYKKSTPAETRRRWIMRGKDSEPKKYVNVATGSSKSENLPAIRQELQALGYTAEIVPGPLILATMGGRESSTLKAMPLATDSTSGPTKEVIVAAYVAANADPLDPDPDLDVEAGREPKWSTHSLRRLADTVARKWMEFTGTTEAEIDIYFGWHERILLKSMQVHYAAMNILSRMAKAKITGML
jgi:hypothetical protein